MIAPVPRPESDPPPDDELLDELLDELVALFEPLVNVNFDINIDAAREGIESAQEAIANIGRDVAANIPPSQEE